MLLNEWPEFASTFAIKLSMNSCPWLHIVRSISMRRLATRGPERRAVQMRFDALYAKRFASRLEPSARHLTVDVALLPHLWQIGELGGRSFTVLMTRWPLAEIHRRLDAESKKHPERQLLSDFRAPDSIVRAETEALAAASRIETSNPAIAQLFGDRSRLLPWRYVDALSVNPGRRVVFLGPTAARKGCYEVREAMIRLHHPLTVYGSLLEGPDFWSGVTLETPLQDWFEDVAVIVAPSLIEDRPSRLLEAVARGIPIITTRESGVWWSPLVQFVEFGNVTELTDAIRAHLS